MKVDFNQTLKDFDGKPLRYQPAEPGKQGDPMTLKRLSVDALLARAPNAPAISGDEHMKRFELARQIHKSREPVELESEQAVLVKKLLAEAYGPLLVGQAFEMIEGKADTKAFERNGVSAEVTQPA